MVGRIIVAVAVVGMTALVGSAFWTRHNESAADAEAARATECREVREAVARERRPDGSLPIDDRALNISLGACEDEGR